MKFDTVWFNDKCYSVPKLWEYTKDLDWFVRQVNSFTEINLVTWFTGESEEGSLVIELPNLDSLIKHYHRMLEADLEYPIILSPDGQIMDGMHRLAKAKFENKTYIKCVQFDEWPPEEVQNELRNL